MAPSPARQQKKRKLDETQQRQQQQQEDDQLQEEDQNNNGGDGDETVTISKKKFDEVRNIVLEKLNYLFLIFFVKTLLQDMDTVLLIWGISYLGRYLCCS